MRNMKYSEGSPHSIRQIFLPWRSLEVGGTVRLTRFPASVEGIAECFIVRSGEYSLARLYG